MRYAPKGLVYKAYWHKYQIGGITHRERVGDNSKNDILLYHISITDFLNFINFYILSSGYFTRFSRIVNQLIKLHIFYFLILFIDFFCHSSCFILEHLLQYLAGFLLFLTILFLQYSQVIYFLLFLYSL